MTRVIVEIAKPLGIAIHDHIFVGRDGHASLEGAQADIDWRSPFSGRSRQDWFNPGFRFV
jgi:hypothetical protein